jgi:hypothetical protein
MLFALAGVGVALAMLLMLEAINRFDRWMRAVGLGWLMTGSRSSAVAILWVLRVLIGAFGLFFLVVLIASLIAAALR